MGVTSVRSPATPGDRMDAIVASDAAARRREVGSAVPIEAAIRGSSGALPDGVGRVPHERPPLLSGPRAERAGTRPAVIAAAFGAGSAAIVAPWAGLDHGLEKALHRRNASSTGTPQPWTSRLVSLAMPTTAISSASIASLMPRFLAAAMWLAMQYSQPLVIETAM